MNNHVELTITTVVRQMNQQIPFAISKLSDSQRCRTPDMPWENLHSLQSIRTWRSSKPARRESITIVTQLSLERLEALRGQCWMWSDRTAAVIYVPLVNGGAFSLEKDSNGINGTSLESVVTQLAAFHASLEADTAGCILDLELVVEQFSSEDEPNLSLYPFNAVRNRALMLAQTDAVFLLDVDFLPSTGFVKEYEDPLAYRAMMDSLYAKSALVLPAFGTASESSEGRQLAAAAVMKNKAFAVNAFQAEKLVGFQVKQYPQGHSPTNYTKWTKATKQYSVKYSKGYEPYIVVARQYVPWYDERFRGYGRDKIVHLTHLASFGTKFMVHPQQYVVHMPHKKAATFKATKVSGQWDKVRPRAWSVLL